MKEESKDVVTSGTKRDLSSVPRLRICGQDKDLIVSESRRRRVVA